MRYPHRRSLAGLVVAVALLTACSRTPAEEGNGSGISSVEPLDGSAVARVTLSADAVRRLGIQTATVAEVPGKRESRTMIPYAAVLYDPSGGTWTYTNPEPNVFIRAPISVDRIEGNRALLDSGPPSGTEVVTVGAAELLGTEYEVGEE